MALAFALLPTAVSAQKAPSLGYVFPPVARCGATTEVQLGGYDFTPDMQFFVHDPQVQLEVLGPPGDFHVPPPPYWHGPRASTPAAPIPREVAARLHVAEDAPEGLVYWRVANANGSSSTAVFYRSRGQEVLEHRSRDFPQRLDALPIAVSGRLSRLTEVDRYEITAQQDGPLTVTMLARQLGADVYGQLQVHDAEGTLLADFADTLGRDGAVTFAARAGETYTISLNDVDFRGDRAFVYRLAFAHGPRILATVPTAGQRGTKQNVEFIGWGVATGAATIESVHAEVVFPADTQAPTCTHLLDTPCGTAEVLIPLSDGTEIIRDAATLEAQRLAPAGTTALAVTGRFTENVAEHEFTWEAAQGESWAIDVASRAVGGTLDVAVSVLAPNGTKFESDDRPGTTDARVELVAPVAGLYHCVVRDLTAREGRPDEIYRLVIQRPKPDFVLTSAQSELAVPLGGAAELTVKALRAGGFAGDISLAVEQLPPGIAVEGELKIPGDQSEHKLLLRAAPDAAATAALIRIRGTATLGEAVVQRELRTPAAGNLAPRDPDEQQLGGVLLAITMEPPFDLELIDAERQREVPRGTTYLAPFLIHRKNGFMGPLQLEMAAQQARYRQGIRGPIVHVPAGAGEAFYPCFMPEWLATDLTRRMVVQGVAAVADPQGNVRSLVKQAPSRITMILEGALLKLSAPTSEISAAAGDKLEVPITISRSPKLPLAVTVELEVPAEVAGRLRADPLTLPPEIDQGTLTIHAADDASLQGPWSLRLVATALEDGQWPVVSETELPVVFSVPSE